MAWKCFQAALDAFVERLRQDRHVLAAVLLGSLDEKTPWAREGLDLWIIESDGAGKREASDGEDPRRFRVLAENDINIHAEIIPRAQFKARLEGASRHAFGYSFFAKRILLYSHDASIPGWFEQAHRLAKRDQQHEALVHASHVIHGLHFARKVFIRKQDYALCAQEVIGLAWGLAALHVIDQGMIEEDLIIHRALRDRPELFAPLYHGMMISPEPAVIEQALDRIAQELALHGETWLQPLLNALSKEEHPLPLSRLADIFAHSRLYPWHLEQACEWLVRQGKLAKLAEPYRLTQKSRVAVEEPAYGLAF